MEKASKWIRNHLIGRKEEKYKIDMSSNEKRIANVGSKMESPKVKRKWSFGRISSKVAVNKLSRSFDSSDSAKLHIQPMGVVETQVSNSLSTTLAEVTPKDKERAAATKIQAAFRSYLARKALHALRGLVKIQALVRGHLVRKQTSATLRGMHALMAIQVRARIHRIQTAEEVNLLVRKQSSPHGHIPRDKALIIRQNKDSKDTSLTEMLEVMKSRSGPLDRLHIKSTEHVATTPYSKHLSVSKRHQYKDNTLIREPSSPASTVLSELNPTKALPTCQRQSVSHRYAWSPNYMTKTESSRAKTRSYSEPKQRPIRGMRQKNKPIESTKELIISLDGRRQYLFSDSSRYNNGSVDHWVINHYEPLTDSKTDSFSSSNVATSDSYH